MPKILKIDASAREAILAGTGPMELKRGIDAASIAIVGETNKNVMPVICQYDWIKWLEISKQRKV